MLPRSTPPILSICIPTYNRSVYLKEALLSIINSAKGYENHIEIVISDNASTDDTRNIVEEFKSLYPYIKYHRNSENIGPEKNFYLVALMVKGKYLWLFGDDDKMAESAISTVLSKLTADVNLIICNYSCFSKDFKRVVQKTVYNINKIDNIRDHNLALKIFRAKLSFISSIIVKKEIFTEIQRDEYEKYAEYGLSFLITVYSGIVNNCNAVYINTPLVYNRLGNSREPDWCKFFVTGPAHLFRDLERKGFSAHVIKRIKNRTILDYIVNYIINAKADGRPYKNVYDSLSVDYRDCWMYWVACLPLLVVPDIFLKTGKRIYRRLSA